MDSQTLLRRLLPRVIAWGERTAERAARHGLPLQDTALADASAVGVRQPERIRVLLVDDFPLPEETLLARAAGALGFFGAATAGLTLGYSILVRRGRLSRSLLSHECRHVAQVEAAGSLSAFLTAYLTSVVSVGYDHCPFELDARRHELPNESLRWRPI